MSYCPADGRLLGTGIKPATVEDVNKAVRAAKAAQREWATTTFAERRKVMRTLLKYVAIVGPWCFQKRKNLWPFASTDKADIS